MKVKVLPTEKYDNTAPREIFAAVVGSISLVIFVLNKEIGFIPHPIFDYVNVAFRIVSAVWVYHIMDKLNRDTIWSAIAAFIFPLLVLIIAGVVKKKNIRFKIDKRYNDDQQITEIRRYANNFAKKEKYTEAAFVYKYIISKLPFTQVDEETYNSLSVKSQIPVPEFNLVDIK